MATEFECYYDPLSQPCRTVLLLLKLTNAPHKIKWMDMSKDEHMTSEFMALNPFHQLPIIVHGDFVLTESTAIAKYITSTVQCDDHWYPADIQKRARVDEYLAHHPTGIRRGCRWVAKKFVFIESMTGKPVPQEEKEAAYAEFQEVLDGFENYFLKRGPFIIGNKISIADLFAVSEVIQAQIGGRDFLSDRPKLEEWVQRVKKETNPHFDDVFKTTSDFIATIAK
ncbi:Glutathione S-transferase theta-1 [Holothuria leucospilota]|uniref:Glutathione S-transferase theta-1 n=1 Tax=Holothuria leucospilota TaxID=206669 RepID=A0A9Q0YJY6_HOLLE|nr:Glutathione S-transferase theta-1 [Holothuria leucospilota]